MFDYPVKARYVGRDLEGKLCQFLETKTDRIRRIFREPFLWVWWYLNGSVSTASALRFVFTNVLDQRTKRIVQYRDPSDVWNYIGGGKRLPGATAYMIRGILVSDIASSPMEYVVITHKKRST